MMHFRLNTLVKGTRIPFYEHLQLHLHLDGLILWLTGKTGWISADLVKQINRCIPLSDLTSIAIFHLLNKIQYK